MVIGPHRTSVSLEQLFGGTMGLSLEYLFGPTLDF